MTKKLSVSIGQYSDKGRKALNQDFHGAHIPTEPLLSAKGLAIALADGISSSDVSQIASQAAVNGFLNDYFSTAEAWSVKTSGLRVLTAINAWLHAQFERSQYRFDKNRGYVCTFSALVVKSATAHLFHTGDSRIFRLQDNTLEQLTQDHRFWVSEEKSYLSRALGINPQPEIDYQSLLVAIDDIFLLATDGVYEYIDTPTLIDYSKRYAHDLNAAAKHMVTHAIAMGSQDNLTVQLLRIDSLPDQAAHELLEALTQLPFPPLLEARMDFDGYQIIRELHASSRSHVYLALDAAENVQVVIKIPAIDLRDNPAYIERFLMEEWIAKRLNHANVLKPCTPTRKRHFIYTVSEFIEGQTLRQWMIDHPQADIAQVRPIIEQIAKGLRAFHRLEMLHQDLRPENIMIDALGTVKIIDFGATEVAGVSELISATPQQSRLGTAQYSAPEYFLGEAGSACADLFSLGVITYEMLTGQLPYGAAIARTKTSAAQQRLHYHAAREVNHGVPQWVDAAIAQAVQIDPRKRYQELSEFMMDLRRPNPTFLKQTKPPLLARNPVLFWQCVSLLLACVIVGLLIR